MKRSPLVAGALAAAVLAAVSVWGFAQLPGLWVWAAFIGWASYDQSGANRSALLSSSICLVFGVVMAWLVALAVAAGVFQISNTPASAICAGLASFVIVYVSQHRALSNVPATFYGFASTFAVLLLAPHTFSLAALTAVDVQNVLVCLPLSLLIGSTLGVVHQRLATLLTAPEQRALPPPATRLAPAKRTH